MGRGRSKAVGGGGGGAAGGGATTNVTVINAGGGTPVNQNIVYGKMTDADASKLRQEVDDNYDPDVTAAIKLYISDSNPNGDGFSHSQNLNYKLDNGLPLNATEKFIDDNIQAGMHPIGQNTQLDRFCHEDILQQCGISDYTQLTEAQLKQRLIGMEVQTTSYLSASYDASKSPFAPNNPKGGGREVIMHINTGANTQTVFGARKQAEMILNKDIKIRFTDARFDGTYAYPRNKGAKPRVELWVETFG